MKKTWIAWVSVFLIALILSAIIVIGRSSTDGSYRLVASFSGSDWDREALDSLSEDNPPIKDSDAATLTVSGDTATLARGDNAVELSLDRGRKTLTGYALSTTWTYQLIRNRLFIKYAENGIDVFDVYEKIN